MISGNLYEKDSSTSKKVELSIRENIYIITHNDDTIFSGQLSLLKISPRVGSILRKIELEEGLIFTTKENSFVDEFLIPKKNILHKLESSFILIILSISVTILLTFSFFKWGVPYSSKKLAFMLPANFNVKISENALEALDEYLLKKTKLDDKKKKEILASFQKNVQPYIENKDFNIKLNFREWKMGKQSIPNALALPDGNIIITDELIRLSKNSEELNAVIYHEIGHIVNRHSLQRIIESSFVTVFLMYISGDATAISDFGVGLGSILIDTNYSRKHELDADEYALKKMLNMRINPENFSNILEKITNKKSTKKTIFNYFSSHPTNKERYELVEKYKKCFQMKRSECK